MKNGLIKSLFLEPFEKFYESVIQYLPNIMSFLLIIVAGVVLGKVLKVVSVHVFRLVHIDKFSERAGIRNVLMKGGIRDNLSVLLSRLVGWGTVFVFLIIALNVLAVPEVERVLGTFFLYLPNVFIAIAILFAGYLLGNFLSRATLITAVNSGIGMPGAIARAVKLGIFVLAATMALEQLGIGRDTIVIAFTIIFGGIVLALSLALGLGGKDLARGYLERMLKAREETPRKEDDIQHI